MNPKFEWKPPGMEFHENAQAIGFTTYLFSSESNNNPNLNRKGNRLDISQFSTSKNEIYASPGFTSSETLTLYEKRTVGFLL
jgi:hypothetical protein